ncbi:MAG TPA: acyl-CoA dehydrogenase family protein [Stellaceae bacterium]|nr:acyl-CoA dehydrogenase family protein [Stellaceae bacterium]
MEGSSARPTAGEIIARASALLPELRKRAEETEKLRRLPDDLNRAFAAAGFYKIMQPARYGGYELPLGTQTELGAELGRACGSAAWVASIISCHAWLGGMFPKEAQDEIWGSDQGATIASSFMPVGAKTERGAGGYRVSGRWRFSSGVDHCQWAVVVLPVPPRAYFALLKLADCRIEDVWHSVGLAGTGSNDIVVENVFLAEHRLLDMDAVRGGPSPGSAVNPHYLYRLPLLACFTFNIVGSGLGIARGLSEAVLGGLKAQVSRAGAKVAEHQSIHLRIAEALAEIDAARALVFTDRDEIVKKAEAGDEFTLLDRVRYRRDMCFAGRLCLNAVERLFPIAGAQGLMNDQPVQRLWRDMRAVSHHLGMTWDIQGSLYGAVALGLPSPDTKI